MLMKFYAELRRLPRRVARSISIKLHELLYNGPKVGPFVFARTTVCGVPLRLITHENDKVISEWIRHGLNASPLGLAAHQQAAELARNASTIVDVGSNIGVVSILMARAAPRAKIFAFEPDPINFAVSQVNLELNGCSNVTAINAAVTDFTGPILLHKAREHWGDHRTYSPNETGPEFGSDAHRIMAIDPKTFFSAVGAEPALAGIDLLKIHAQGSDIRILKAFHPLLRSGSKVIHVLSPRLLKASGISEQDIRETLGPAGRLQAIGPKADDDGKWLPRDVTLDELIEFFRTGVTGFHTVGYRYVLAEYCYVLADWR